MFVTGGSRKITGREMRFKKVERAWIRSSTPRRDTFSFVSGLRSIIYFLRKLFHASRRDLSPCPGENIFFSLLPPFPPVDLRFKPRYYAFKPRDPRDRKSPRDVWPRCVCVCVCVRYFLFHLAIVNADWSNLMFFSSLPEKRESFSRFSLPPITFLSHRSNHAKVIRHFSYLLFIYLFIFYESLDLRVFFPRHRYFQFAFLSDPTQIQQ